jgi:AcrR family transcriptional regulator
MTGRSRRESILEVAAGVFGEVGYLRGKMSEIARRVGVSEPVIFQNFGSKAALYAAVVERAAERMCADLERQAAEKSVSGVLEALLDPGHLEQLHAVGSVGALFADAASVPNEPTVEAAARGGTQRFASVLTGLLERGQSTGELRGELDPESAAWWLLSLAAAQKFRLAAAPAPAKIEAGLAKSTLEFLTAPGR